MKTNYWTTRDGQQIAVEDLGDEHLLNILNMLKKNDRTNFRGMKISNTIEENREQLNLILGENKYISCAKQEIKDKFKGDSYHNPFQGEIASEQWDYHMLGGSDYDEIDDPYCFGIY